MKTFTYTNEKGKSIVFDNNPASTQFLLSLSGNLGKTEQTYNVIGQDGAITGNAYLNARTIMCDMIYEFRGVSYADYKRQWQNIVSVLSPKLKGTITYATEYGNFKIDVKPFETPELVDGKFTIQFVADNPMWRDANATEYVFGTVKPLWRFPFTFANGPLKMGEWQKSFTYDNTSGIETPFKIVINGVGDYCKITNDNGEFIKVNKSISAGQTLTIDTATGIVTLAEENGAISYANQYVSLDSTLDMKLHEGVNKLTYDNSLTSLPVATISINQYYLGV